MEASEHEDAQEPHTGVEHACDHALLAAHEEACELLESAMKLHEEWFSTPGDFLKASNLTERVKAFLFKRAMSKNFGAG